MTRHLNVIPTIHGSARRGCSAHLHRWRVAVTLAAAAGALCCGNEPSSPATAVSTDSTGTVQVRFASLTNPGEPLRLSKVFEVGAEPTLNGVVGARLLEDGNLVVANAGDAQVIWFDKTGRFVRTVGRRGDGPGEYQKITAVLERPEGGVLVYDARPGRVTELDANGQLVGTRPLSSGSLAVDLVPLTASTDGSLLAVQGESRVFASRGAVRDSTPLLRIDTAGVQTHTAGFWKGKDWYYAPIDRGVARLPVGFGRDVVYAGRRGRAVVCSTDSLDVSVIGDDLRLLMRVRGPSRNQPVSAADASGWQADLSESMKTAPPELQAMAKDIPAYETYPDLKGVGISESGSVWIGLRSTPGSEEEEWIVVAPDGRDIQTTELPKSSRVLDVRGSNVAVLHRDRFDQEFVTVYRLQ